MSAPEEVYSDDEPICPWCQKADDSWWEYSGLQRDGDEVTANCGSCEKDFTINMSVRHSFTTRAPEAPPKDPS